MDVYVVLSHRDGAWPAAATMDRAELPDLVRQADEWYHYCFGLEPCPVELGGEYPSTPHVSVLAVPLGQGPEVPEDQRARWEAAAMERAAARADFMRLAGFLDR